MRRKDKEELLPGKKKKIEKLKRDKSHSLIWRDLLTNSKRKAVCKYAVINNSTVQNLPNRFH